MTYYPTVGDGSQALDLGTLYKLVQGSAVLSGLDVTINSGDFDATDSLSVASGTVIVDGTKHSVSATDVGIDSASNNPRKDVVYVDGNGDVQVAKGQEAEPKPVDEETGQHAIREHAHSPSPPDLSGMAAVPIAEIWVDNEASSLEEADRRDRRSPGKIPTAVLKAIAVSDLDFDPATQSELNSHAGATDAHHAQDHASRHHQGGDDEILAEDLGANSTDDDAFFGPDGNGGIEVRGGSGGPTYTWTDSTTHEMESGDEITIADPSNTDIAYWVTAWTASDSFLYGVYHYNHDDSAWESNDIFSGALETRADSTGIKIRNASDFNTDLDRYQAWGWSL